MATERQLPLIFCLERVEGNGGSVPLRADSLCLRAGSGGSRNGTGWPGQDFESVAAAKDNSLKP